MTIHFVNIYNNNVSKNIIFKYKFISPSAPLGRSGISIGWS